MKVLAINGSARRDGNTAFLISTVLEKLNQEGIETEMIQLSGGIIEPCRACWACGGKKNCVHKKDQFQEIYEKMVQTDGILLGSPVYTANISANMQAFLERASVVADMNRNEHLLRHKVGAAVTAARRGGALNTLDAMNHFFMLQDMFIVGSSYWSMAYGQMPGEVSEDREGLETVRNLGRNMAYLLRTLEERRKRP
ncbi:MAG: flavodoxin family protein [Acetatifactor sp.]